MGFSKTTAASFFSVLGGSNKVDKVNVDMDAAAVLDAMEHGFAQALARNETEPVTAEAPKRKMHVERSEDRTRHVLFNEEGAPVLEAQVMTEGIEIYAAGGDSKVTIDLPACTLTHDKEMRNWKISSSYCNKCAYRNPYTSCKSHGGKTLAVIRHAKETIGEGVAMCMDADIPQIGADGQTDIWCPLCQGSDNTKIELNSLRPRWNEKLKSLCMAFKGCVEAASAKNFQLCLDDKVVLVYGKKANGTFCLEFEHPLSPLQAFAIAMTTQNWS